MNTIKAIQCDLFNTEAFYFLPLLLKGIHMEKLKKPLHSIVSSLKKWNFKNDESCLVCGLYRTWMNQLFKESQIKGSLKENALYNLLKQGHEKINEKIHPSFLKSLKKLKIKSIKDLKPWGEINRSFFPTLMGEKSSSSLSTPGGKHSVNVSKMYWKKNLFESRFGSSQRVIVELSSPPKAWKILAGPQPGYHKADPQNPQGPWKKWKNCRLERLLFPFNWNDVKSTSIHIPKSLKNKDVF